MEKQIFNKEPIQLIQILLFVVLLAFTTLQPLVTMAAFPGYNGKLVFSRTVSGNEDIYSMNLDGSDLIRLTTTAGSDNRPAISPDGTKIVFKSARTGDFEIFIMNIDGSNQINLSNDPATDDSPSFYPSGEKVIFTSSRTGDAELHSVNTDGSNPNQIMTNPGYDGSAAVSPDGTKIAFNNSASGNADIFVMNIDGTNMMNLTNALGHDREAQWSPDGTKILFDSPRSGNSEIYVMNADGTNVINVSNATGTDLYAQFSPDGTSITYNSTRDGGLSEIYKADSDGSNPLRITNDAFAEGYSRIQPLSMFPVLNSDSVTVASGQQLTSNVLANDVDIYGGLDLASLTISTQPTYGVAEANATTGVITYKANPGYSGNDTVRYRVCSLAHTQLCSIGVLGVSVTATAVTETSGQLAQTGESQMSSILFATVFIGIIMLSLGYRKWSSSYN